MRRVGGNNAPTTSELLLQGDGKSKDITLMPNNHDNATATQPDTPLDEHCNKTSRPTPPTPTKTRATTQEREPTATEDRKDAVPTMMPNNAITAQTPLDEDRP